jgi:hypothetical protein
MRGRWWSLSVFIPMVAALLSSCAHTVRDDAQAESIRQVERQRLHALVDFDSAVAFRLHADDFQLITPDGSEYDKARYLGQLQSGELDYRAWDPGPIKVRVYGNAAVIRYDDTRFEVAVSGQLVWTGTLRHIDLYEKRAGQWQVVWSQASGGQAPP